MRPSQVAVRYAQALRDSIEDVGQLEPASGTLTELASLFSGDPELRSALANPTHSLEDRRRLLDMALDAYGATQPVRRLVYLLLERNRIALLESVAVQFDEHLDDWLDRAEATVTTAIPLTDDLKGRLVQSLEQFAGKTVRVKYRVDSDIIGGIVVKMWGVYFDVSLRTRLERLRKKLLSKETLGHGH